MSNSSLQFEFHRIKVINASKTKIYGEALKKLQRGEELSPHYNRIQRADIVGKEMLDFAGKNGWEIKGVSHENHWMSSEKDTRGNTIDVKREGDVDIYYLQRNSSHEKFGTSFQDEYAKSKLYMEHRNIVNYGQREEIK